MQQDRIHYRGCYEYADSATLERTLARARAEIDEDELVEALAWLRFFVCRGNRLTVNVALPASSEHRFAAANLFLVLAHGAIDGSVQAITSCRAVDEFVAGGDD
jgi:hypothetical protein